MKAYWTRFENWLEQNAPHLLSVLNDGASQLDIDKLENLINKKLPKDFVQFYEIHNGQIHEKGGEGLIHREELLSIESIIIQWESWDELRDYDTFEDLTSDPDDGVKNDWWNPLWIPFTNDGSGNHICIDLDPAPNGTFGQVMRMWHDSKCRQLYGKSFSEYISNYISGLETGKLVYAAGWGLVGKDSIFNQQ